MMAGRHLSIPLAYFETVFSLQKQGLGYRRIANRLMGVGVATTYSSVRRFLLRLPPYGNTA